jgi:catechol 2,3-dioxygenase-like lactoylglutathione lyase family enzyme
MLARVQIMGEVSMPRVTGVLETSLYVDDLDRSVRFYRSLFGLEVLVADDRFCALNVADRQVLLLFRKGASLAPIPVLGSFVPAHDGEGPLHMAFAIPAEDWAAWEERLRANGIPSESTITWPRGGRSLYFRDPDQHLIELATPGLWAIY